MRESGREREREGEGKKASKRETESERRREKEREGETPREREIFFLQQAPTWPFKLAHHRVLTSPSQYSNSQ